MTSSPALPDLVVQASTRAVQYGFRLSCEPEVGRLLAALAAAVPANGRILELGTGVGVGSGWLVHGLGSRTDVEVTSVEIDRGTAEVAAQLPWPNYVHLVVGDALDVIGKARLFDLVFADAEGGKWEGLGDTLSSLRPGGHLLVDDMIPPRFTDPHHQAKINEVRTRILDDPALASVEIQWATGLILATRRVGAT